MKMLSLFVLSFLLGGICASGAEAEKAVAPIVPKRQADPKPAFVPRPEFEKNFALLKARLQGNGADRVDPAMKIEKNEKCDGYSLLTVSYHVETGERIEGYLLIPGSLKKGEKRPLVLCLHETNSDGKDALIFRYAGKAWDAAEAEKRKNRAYAVDLVKRGFICFAPDRAGYGKRCPVQPANGIPGMKEYEKKFAAEHPDWNYNYGKINHDLAQALDFLVLLPEVDAQNIGVMGHSLGGWDSMKLIAFDDRIKAAAVSCGGALRYREELWTDLEAQRKYAAADNRSRQADNMNFFIQAAAPRPLLILMALNDYLVDYPKNLLDGMRPVKLYYDSLAGGPKELAKQGPFSVLVHTCGHDTPFEVRAYAYEWLERQLTGRQKD